MTTMTPIARSTVVLDSELVREAERLAAGTYDEGAISALDPADWAGYVVYGGSELIDGCHRIMGVARWAREQGIDLDDDDPIYLPCLWVPTERYEAEHPRGISTPTELVERWAAEAIV